MYPRSPADLTASSLGRALSIDPSSIASVETELIGQGVGILCQVARVRLAYREGVQGPKSVVAKFPAAIEQTRGLARQFKFYEREINFYKHLAKDVSLPSPVASTPLTNLKAMISCCCWKIWVTAGSGTS